MLLCLCINACTPVTSDRPRPVDGLTGEQGMKGVFYYLPQPRIELQLSRKLVKVAGKTTVVKTPVQPPSPSPKKESPLTPAAAAEPGVPGAGYQATPGVSTVSAAGAGNGDSAFTTTTTTEPEKVGATLYQFKIVRTQLVPDPSQPFRLLYHPSALAVDDFSVTVGTDGLLTKVRMSAEDKSAEIIIKLIDTAKEVSKSLLLSEPDTKAESEWTIVWNATFNPLTETRAINSELRQRFPGANLAVELIDEGQGVTKAYKDNFRDAPNGFSGVAFRPVLPFTLKCSQGSSVLNREVLLLPDPQAICSFPIQRSAFVKRVTQLDFDHGVLTGVSVTKDSEVLAFMEIPLALAKAITDIPANLVQVRLNQTKNDSAQTEAQAALLEAEKKRLDDANALRQARQPHDTLR